MTAAVQAAVPAHDAIEVGVEDSARVLPGPKAPLWSMHPRVFLDVTPYRPGQLPYCGAAYLASTRHGRPRPLKSLPPSPP